MERTDTAVVADAGLLIHLDELHCLDLLLDFNKVLLSSCVITEVVAHRPDFSSSDLIFTICPELLQMSDALHAVFSLFSLHQGEQQSILIAHTTPGIIFLTDDAAARLAASQLGIKVHGTIGVLLRSIRRGHRTKKQVAEIISSIPQKSSLHLRQNLLHEMITTLKTDG